VQGLCRHVDDFKGTGRLPGSRVDRGSNLCGRLTA